MIGHDSRNMFSACDRLERYEKMNNCVKKYLEKAQRHPNIEGTAERSVQLIEFSRDQVGKLLNTYPPASLAWSGFCIIGPVRQIHVNATASS